MSPEVPASPTGNTPTPSPLSKCALRRMAKRAEFRKNWVNLAPNNGQPLVPGRNLSKRRYAAAVEAERNWMKAKLKAEGIYGHVRITAAIAKLRAEIKAK